MNRLGRRAEEPPALRQSWHRPCVLNSDSLLLHTEQRVTELIRVWVAT